MPTSCQDGIHCTCWHNLGNFAVCAVSVYKYKFYVLIVKDKYNQNMTFAK